MKALNWFIYGCWGVAVARITTAMFGLAFPRTTTRDAWLVTNCGRPSMVMFLDENGKLEQHQVTSLDDVGAYAKRMKAAPHKYVLEVHMNCSILTAEAL